MKKRGKQEKSDRTRGDRTSVEGGAKQERCVLCNGKHLTQNCKHLAKCQRMVKDSTKPKERDCFAIFPADEE